MIIIRQATFIILEEILVYKQPDEADKLEGHFEKKHIK